MGTSQLDREVIICYPAPTLSNWILCSRTCAFFTKFNSRGKERKVGRGDNRVCKLPSLSLVLCLHEEPKVKTPQSSRGYCMTVIDSLKRRRSPALNSGQ
jgi:hypothetical protein